MTAKSSHTRYAGDVKGYKTKYLRCRGRKRHPWRTQTHANIVEKNGRIIEFTEVLTCHNNCGVIRENVFDVTPAGRFVLRESKMDYSNAPGYLVEKGNVIPDEDARDELMLRTLTATLDTHGLDLLAKTRPMGEQTPPSLRVVRDTA